MVLTKPLTIKQPEASNLIRDQVIAYGSAGINRTLGGPKNNLQPTWELHTSQ